MVKINGEILKTPTVTLKAYLTENNYSLTRVAVECNEEIVPKNQYETFKFNDGDTIEVVSFVGGG